MGKKKNKSGNYGEFAGDSMPNKFSPAASVGECTGLIPSGKADDLKNAKSIQPLETQYVASSKKSKKKHS